MPYIHSYMSSRCGATLAFMWSLVSGHLTNQNAQFHSPCRLCLVSVISIDHRTIFTLCVTQNYCWTLCVIFGASLFQVANCLSKEVIAFSLWPLMKPPKCLVLWQNERSIHTRQEKITVLNPVGGQTSNMKPWYAVLCGFVTMSNTFHITCSHLTHCSY